MLSYGEKVSPEGERPVKARCIGCVAPLTRYERSKDGSNRQAPLQPDVLESPVPFGSVDDFEDASGEEPFDELDLSDRVFPLRARSVL